MQSDSKTLPRLKMPTKNYILGTGDPSNIKIAAEGPS